MPRGAADRPREERVARSRDRSDPSVGDSSTYVPIGDAVAKLRRWAADGARIDYLSSNREPARLAGDASILRRNHFPPGRLVFRGFGESYGDVVARELPDLLVEDDCESLGAQEVAYPQIPLPQRRRIGSIVVPEFGGIDHLPDSVRALLEVGFRGAQPPVPGGPESSGSRG